MTQELLKRFDLLAEKFGATGQYLWEKLVQKEFAEGLWCLWAFIFVTGISFYLWRKIETNQSIEDAKETYYEKFPFQISRIAVLMFGILFGLVFSHAAIMGLFAPEAQALKTILEALK